MIICSEAPNLAVWVIISSDCLIVNPVCGRLLDNRALTNPLTYLGQGALFWWWCLRCWCWSPGPARILLLLITVLSSLPGSPLPPLPPSSPALLSPLSLPGGWSSTPSLVLQRPHACSLKVRWIWGQYTYIYEVNEIFRVQIFHKDTIRWSVGLHFVRMTSLI